MDLSNFIEKRKGFLLFIILAVAIYFPLFLQMDRLPVRAWDESIMGVNALRMLENNNYLVTYFVDAPDLSNTKPPLFIWCIVLFSKIFGFSEFSMRLPSALAALALCIYLYVALRKYTGSYAFGFFVVIVLITTQGYIHTHVTRTGEYDSMLVLFSTLFSLHLFFAIETENIKERKKYLFLFFVFLTLAVLTKGIACMMQAPGLFIYALARKKVLVFLKTNTFYFGLSFFLLFGLGFYFLRESLSPGYLNAVWENELGGRFGQTNEGHKGPFWQYFNEIFTYKFASYIGLLLAGAIVGVQLIKESIGRLVGFCIVTALSFWFFISMAQTKLPWYDAPIFPYFAVITASFIYFLYAALKEKVEAKGYAVITSSIISIFICALIFVKPYDSIIATVYAPKPESWEAEFANSCHYFQHAVRNQVNANGQKFVFDFGGDFSWHRTVVWCYERQLKEKNINAAFLVPENVEVNDTVMTFEGQTIGKLQEKFEMVYVDHIEPGNANRWLVQGLRQPKSDSN